MIFFDEEGVLLVYIFYGEKKNASSQGVTLLKSILFCIIELIYFPIISKAPQKSP